MGAALRTWECIMDALSENKQSVRDIVHERLGRKAQCRTKRAIRPGKVSAREANPCHARSPPVFEHALDHADRYRALAVGRGGAIALGGVHKPRVDLARAESVSE